MWLCERKVSIPSAGARERKWVIKPGGKKRPRRRAGASDSGIHLIALKWKRFLASRSLCLKKSQIKSPHVYQPGSDFSSSSMSANPSFFFFYFSAAIGNIIINIEKAAVHRQQMPKGGISSDAHLRRPEKSLGKEDINTSLLKVFILAPFQASSWQI